MTDIPETSLQTDPVEDTTAKAQGKPAPALLVFLILPLVGILVALLMVLFNDNNNPALSTAPIQTNSLRLIDSAAPPFELSNLDGQRVNLSDYAGRPLLLNFWQTTCAPCVRELPAFSEFISNQGETGTAVLAINFDETAADINRFFTQNNISGIPVVLDIDSTVRRAYNIVGIPVTYGIDAEGIIRYWQVGEMSLEEMEEMAAALQGEDPGQG